MGEDPLELGANEEGMADFSKGIEWQGVVNEVGHHDAAVGFLEGVEVMPEFVWAEALFIDE